MSIPVEKRDLANGWTLTCRGAGGGDLTLTELIIKVRLVIDNNCLSMKDIVLTQCLFNLFPSSFFG